MQNLSKYLTYEAAIRSDTAIKNRIQNLPGTVELKNLRELGENVYDKVCDKFGPVFPSSVFRNVRVNQLVGGSSTSGHTKGQCIDIDGDAPNGSYKAVDNIVLFYWIKDNLEFDQLIAEYEQNGRPKWVHVGYRKGANRKQVLIAVKNSAGNVVYLPYSDKLFKNIFKSSRGINDITEFVYPEVDAETTSVETVSDDFEIEYLENRVNENPTPLSGKEEVAQSITPDVEVGASGEIKVKISGIELTINVKVL